MKHSLSNEEWLDGYARKNVHPIIVSYIESYPEFIYKEANEDGKAYASPRSWTFLSDYIVANYGMESKPDEFLPDLYIIASSYIGVGAKKFITYCDDMMKLNIEDIINNFDGVKKDLENYKRDKKSELIQSLKKKDIESFTDFQLKNISNFLKIIGEDELTAYLLGILDTPSNTTLGVSPKLKEFLRQFRKNLIKTQIINNKNNETAPN